MKWRFWFSFIIIFTCAAKNSHAQVDPAEVDLSELSPELRLEVQGKFDRYIRREDGKLIVDRKDFIDFLLNSRGTISVVSPKDEMKSDLARIIRSRMELLQQTYMPSVASAIISSEIAGLRKECSSARNETAEACFLRKGGGELAAILLALKNRSACDIAAKNYMRYRRDCEIGCPAETESAVREAFDAECLSSNVPWKRGNGTLESDPEPEIFRSGGENEGKAGVLDAVVLIEESTGGGWKHRCGGILLSGNRVLTAAHCFFSPHYREALAKGRMIARPIRGNADQAFILKYDGGLPDEMPIPSKDIIVLKLISDKIIPAPRVVFREPVKPEPATVVGYFHDYDSKRVLADSMGGGGVATINPRLKAIRWPKDGMCYVIEAKNGCIRSLCQTIEGYSGSPVFSISINPGEPLTVFGIISMPDHADAKCGVSNEVSTLLSSPIQIQP